MNNFNNDFENFYKKPGKSDIVRLLLVISVGGGLFYAFNNAQTKQERLFLLLAVFVVFTFFYLYMIFTNVTGMVKKMYEEEDEYREDYDY